MSFSDMINQLGKKKEELQREDDLPPDAASTSAPDHEPVASPEAKSAGEGNAAEEDLDDAIQLFETIREIVGEDEDFLRIPLRALTSRLPEKMRGSGWDPASIPDGNLQLEIQPLLAKLRSGKVSYQYSELVADLPEGWVEAEPDDEIELDLAIVFSAVPPELIEISSRISETMEQILDMPDYFSAKGDGARDEEPAATDTITEELSQPEEEENEPSRPAAEEQPGSETGPAPQETTAGQAAIEEPAMTEPDMARPKEDFPAEKEITASGPEGDELSLSEAAATLQESAGGAAADSAAAEAAGAGNRPAAEEPPESDMTATAQQSGMPVLKPARHEPAYEYGWSGRESVSASVSPTDLNSASPRELELLPGLGESKAAAIIRYREVHGDLESIYDLLSIPGIGARNFEAMTGLDPDKREDRSLRMKRMLGLPENGRPRLSAIAKAIVGKFNAEACILAGSDGIIISQSGSIASDEARQYAALAPKIFRGTKKYLAHLEGLRPHMVALPGSNPPILFVGLQHLFMALALKRQENLSAIIADVGALAEELDWFFSKRAIVGK